MKRIVIVGGGYAGFYAALGLERKLKRSDEAEVVLIDPRPYMTYQPFLPEILAGSIEARHALVSLRRNLPRTRVISGSVVGISHAEKAAIVRPYAGDDYPLSYDAVVSNGRSCHAHLPGDWTEAGSDWAQARRGSHCDPQSAPCLL